jgi:invasion protein IalB
MAEMSGRHPRLSRGVAAALALMLLTQPAARAPAQDRSIDPQQAVDHFKVFGPWEVMCDARPGGRDRRCYIRLVDVYAPRPDLKAAMMFITAEPGSKGKAAYRFSMAIEPGNAWAQRPLGLALPGRPAAGLPMVRCTLPACVVAGDDADALADTLAANSRPDVSLILTFRERDGTPRSLSWPLAELKGALADFAAARQARDLP